VNKSEVKMSFGTRDDADLQNTSRLEMDLDKCHRRVIQLEQELHDQKNLNQHAHQLFPTYDVGDDDSYYGPTLDEDTQALVEAFGKLNEEQRAEVLASLPRPMPARDPDYGDLKTFKDVFEDVHFAMRPWVHGQLPTEIKLTPTVLRDIFDNDRRVGTIYIVSKDAPKMAIAVNGQGTVRTDSSSANYVDGKSLAYNFGGVHSEYNSMFKPPITFYFENVRGLTRGLVSMNWAGMNMHGTSYLNDITHGGNQNGYADVDIYITASYA